MKKKTTDIPKGNQNKEAAVNKKKTKRKRNGALSIKSINRSSLAKQEKRTIENKKDKDIPKNKSKTIRAKKNFIVVAYDISDDRRRNRIAKILLKYGTRINFSVFECMVTDTQLEDLKKEISGKIKPKSDSVVFYPVCMKCYTKIIYLPPRKAKYEVTTII